MSARQRILISPRAQRGVGLIEVLVAVLIMGIGLLGVAAMQATALRNNQSAFERTQAVVQSYAMLDAIRANPTAAASYTMTEQCTVPTSSTSLIEYDKQAWIASLHATMGAGACGTVSCVDRVCTITVKWDDSRGTALSTTDVETARTVTTTTRI